MYTLAHAQSPGIPGYKKMLTNRIKAPVALQTRARTTAGGIETVLRTRIKGTFVHFSQNEAIWRSM